MGSFESQDGVTKSSAASALPRWAIVSVAVASALGASMLGRSASQGVTPSGCTSIQNVPANYTISYGAAVQGLFDNFLTNGGTEGCVDCHIAPPSAGNLDLTDGVSWANLVNVTSFADASLKYVVPNHPEQSLLFQKINCDTPAVGHRMPLVDGPLSPEQQALIYDWIAGGAPSGTTSTLFRDGFDIRGFDQ